MALHGPDWHERAVATIKKLPKAKYAPEKWPLGMGDATYWAISHDVIYMFAGRLIDALCVHPTTPSWTMNRHWHPHQKVDDNTVRWCPCCQARSEPTCSLTSACQFCRTAMRISCCSRRFRDKVFFYGIAQPRWPPPKTEVPVQPQRHGQWTAEERKEERLRRLSNGYDNLKCGSGGTDRQGGARKNKQNWNGQSYKPQAYRQSYSAFGKYNSGYCTRQSETRTWSTWSSPEPKQGYKPQSASSSDPNKAMSHNPPIPKNWVTDLIFPVGTSEGCRKFQDCRVTPTNPQGHQPIDDPLDDPDFNPPAPWGTFGAAPAPAGGEPNECGAAANAKCRRCNSTDLRGGFQPCMGLWVCEGCKRAMDSSRRARESTRRLQAEVPDDVDHLVGCYFSV